MTNTQQTEHGGNMARSSIEVGDSVRVPVGNGSFLHGEVQEANDGQAKIRGRWFQLSNVRTEDDIENEQHENRAAISRQRAAEQAAKEASERAEKSEPKVPVILSQKKDLTACERDSFVTSLFAGGYRLHLAARADGIEHALDEYRSWTGGEELPEDCIYMNNTAFTAREWFLEFYYDETISYPFPIIEMGTVGRGSKSDPRGLHHSGKVTACYADIAEYAVRSGIRARAAF